MSDSPVKKGRGRPARENTETVKEAVSPKKAKITEPPKTKEKVAPVEKKPRGRGRPSKASKRAAAAASGVGRGRPKAKKVEEEVLEEDEEASDE